MNNLTTFFVKDNDSLNANNDCIIKGEKYRFTVLTERLIRMEYSESGIFEDRGTELVTNRKFEKPLFSLTENKSIINIKTKYFNLTYLKNKLFKGSTIFPNKNLKVSLNESNKEWYYGHPEVRNFGGTDVSLDDFNGELKLPKGLYSTDGFVTIDDSKSRIIDQDFFLERQNKEIDLYLFMYRKDFGLCLRDYFGLTSFPTLIPRYALGNWWDKNEKYNTDEVIALVENFKKHQIPLSVLILSDKVYNSNYLTIDTNQIDITRLSNYLHQYQIHLAISTGESKVITTNDQNYSEIKNILSINEDKDLSLFPIDQSKINLYLNYYLKKLESIGIDFLKIDYSNIKDYQSLFLLNHYFLTNNSINESKRGLNLSRNSLIAPHRYPILYTGKTKVNWQTLNTLPFYNSSASNIGVSFIANAIGGYHDGIEDEELYLRYIQLGCYSSIFLLGSEAGRYYKREPWLWNIQKQRIVEDYMKLRHSLIPYLYNESYIYSKTGSPLIQPLYYNYPEIYDAIEYRNEYHLGSEFLIAPITKKKDPLMMRVLQKLFIPSGMWYNFRTGKKFPGDKYYITFFKDDDYPVFCKAGSIIPLSLDNNTNIPNNMEIHIFPGQSNTYKLYEDDGISNLYKEDYYLMTSIDYNYRMNNYTVIIRALEGKTGIVPEKRNYKVRFRNTKKSDDVIVYINETKAEFNSYVENNDFILEIKDVPTIGQLTINCKGNDIEIDAVRLINEEIKEILMDVEIETRLKEKIDHILFSDLPIKKKRIEIRKLKNDHLEPKFIKMFIKLLEYINQI